MPQAKIVQPVIQVVRGPPNRPIGSGTQRGSSAILEVLEVPPDKSLRTEPLISFSGLTALQLRLEPGITVMLALLSLLTALLFPALAFMLPCLLGSLAVNSALPAAFFALTLLLHPVFLATPSGLCLSLRVVLSLLLPVCPIVIILALPLLVTPRLHGSFKIGFSPQVIANRAGVGLRVGRRLSRPLSWWRTVDVNIRHRYLLRTFGR